MMFGKKSLLLLSRELPKITKNKSSFKYLSSNSSKISSLSFSGAGFLGCYHVGAVACLTKNGLLWDPSSSNEKLPLLTGVSAGALIIAAIANGVKPEDGMNVVLEVARKTREKTGVLNTFQPGFSLVDEMEGTFTKTLFQALGGNSNKNYDLDLWKRIQAQQRKGFLRIGLTDRRRLMSNKLSDRHNAYVYIDEFRDLQDVVAACVLSSYIPFGTGPLTVKNEDTVVWQAIERVKEMEKLGYVKCGQTGKSLSTPLDESDKSTTIHFLDGGLVENWPTIDNRTVIITPINGDYTPNAFIAPNIQDAQKVFKIREGVAVGINKENVETLTRMLLCSDDEILQEYFQLGYDNANKFLEQYNLKRTFTK